MNAVKLYELQINALKYLIQTFPHHQNKYRKKLEFLLEPEETQKTSNKKLSVSTDQATQTIPSTRKTLKKKINQ